MPLTNRVPSRVVRLISALGCTALAAAVLAGCSADSGKTTLEIESAYPTGSTLLESLESVASAYEAEHPDVDFNIVPAGSDFEARMKARLAANNVPDLMNTHGWSRDRYSQFLRPLQDRPWNADVDATLDPAMRTGDGSIFALPMDVDVSGILYNEQVLKDAGVEISSLATWEGFDRALERIESSGVVPITVSGKALDAQAALIDWMAPGKFTAEELSALQNGKFQDTPYRSVLEHIDRWAKAGYFNPDISSASLTDVAASIGAGKTAFIFTGTYTAADAFVSYPNAQIGYIPIPSDTGKNYLIGGEQNAFGVGKTSPNQDIALDFLAFLAKPENVSKMNQAAGTPSGLKSVPTDVGPLQQSYEQWVVEGKTPLQPFFDRADLPGGMWQTMAATTDSIITQQGDVAQALDQVRQQFDSLYAQANGK
ncbi:ABC transporter substrate-binding protein [Paenarthrobacter sp. NPDC092416]|uniref:ABC transporter substrate-binding protein n=1 Tax=Paenarthrobacter sp. NPDC092416 TaxID=3364386 RepID=UPI0038048841